MIAKQIIDYIERQTNGYGENALLPNDAIALVRRINLNNFAKFIEETVEKSGKPLNEVLQVVGRNINEVNNVFPFISGIIDKIIQDCR